MTNNYANWKPILNGTSDTRGGLRIMATKQMTTKQIADLLLTSLKAFVALAGTWVALDLVADFTNVGFFGTLAAVVFVLALLAMAVVLLVAISLLIE